MAYKTIAVFKDLQDDEGHVYTVGEEYPREGMTVTEERLAELAGSKNLAGYPLIQKMAEKKRPAKKAEKPEKAEEE